MNRQKRAEDVPATSGTTGTEGDEQRYAKLPARIRPEEMIAEQACAEPGDPTLGGRDSERDWLLRYSA